MGTSAPCICTCIFCTAPGLFSLLESMNFLSSTSLRSLKMLQRSMYMYRRFGTKSRRTGYERLNEFRNQRHPVRPVQLTRALTIPVSTGSQVTAPSAKTLNKWTSISFVKGSILFGTDLWAPDWAAETLGEGQCTKCGIVFYGLGSALMMATSFMPLVKPFAY